MTRLRVFIVRLAGLLRKGKLERELEAEIQSHIEMQAEDNVRNGIDIGDAHLAARRSFGGTHQMKERYRDLRGIPAIETVMQDLRYAVRMLAKRPGFTAVIVLTLALGIGATSAIFSVMNAAMLRPLPFPDPDRLVLITEINLQDGSQRAPAPERLLAWKGESRLFEGLAAAAAFRGTNNRGPVSGEEAVFAGALGLETLRLLGVTPILGRWHLPGDAVIDEDALAETIVISHGFWQRRFGGDPDVLGRTVKPGWAGVFETAPAIIVGVMPRGFRISPDAANTEGWYARDLRRMDPNTPGFDILGRLKPGVSFEQAETELTSISDHETDSDAADWRVELRPYQETLSARYAETLYLLLGAVSFVLLIACANIVNLQLGQAASRQREMATRAALGAGRLRLVRQLVAENVLLALLGGGFGILVAVVGMQVFIALAPDFYPATGEIRLDRVVLFFTLILSMIAGLSIGLISAFRASRPDPQTSLKQGGRGTGSGTGQRIRRALVVTEVALTLVLLIGAGLMINSHVRALTVSTELLGFDPENLLTMNVNLDGDEKYVVYDDNLPNVRVTAEVARFFAQVRERFAALPGVESVGMASSLPPLFGEPARFRIIGRSEEEDARATYNEVDADFFDTMRVPLIRGRYFTDRDVEGAPGVVVVNQALARRYFPGEDPLGQLVQVHALASPSELGDSVREIVGVVRDIRPRGGMRNPPRPFMYVPYQQHLWSYGEYYGARTHFGKDFAIRVASSDPMSLSPALRGVLAEAAGPEAGWWFDPQFETMRGRLSRQLGPDQFLMRLLGVFATLGVLLAVIGVYGVVSFAVVERTEEFGIRTAFGARKVDILRLVVREGILLTSIGLLIGLGAAIGLTRYIASQLIMVTPLDPMTFTAVSLTLIAVALLASYIPARRATKADPMAALRVE